MDAILFDLDNTLYHPERELFSLIDVRINRYMSDIVGIAPADVDGLRRRYWADYGVTLQGLIRHHGVDAEDYLDYVHDVNVHERILPDPELCDRLAAIESPCYVFTNGSRAHAERVLACLGIAEQFEEIFDIRIAAYQPKPFPDSYREVMRKVGCKPDRSVMVEDSIENLLTAREMGMKTVLVRELEPDRRFDAHVETASAAASVICGWLAA
ncbi:MAG: pyrimidine 5'-nucleotidase [Desulfuromonas sp.]|nr:MAG: pyrimidine 5'-nucleotidase [Desulfuromonas sp.]